MKNIVVLGAAGLMLNSCMFSPGPFERSMGFRKPASTMELVEGSRLVLKKVQDPQVLTSENCASFVNEVTDYLYALPADYFVPKTSEEKEQFKVSGPEVIDTIFKIRVALRERFIEFSKQRTLTDDCTAKIREGIQYARYAEEYVLDWLYENKIYQFKKTPILANQKPYTWTNSKFEGFSLQAGDVMIIRGKSYVSAMIARIGDEEGNFSHLAIVGEDSNGKKYAVEALIQYGVIVTPLDKWLEQVDSRVALYRHPDADLAKRAALMVLSHAQTELKKRSGIRYDFAMNDDDYSSMFCSEVIKYGFDKASMGQVIVPEHRSKVTKFKNTDYPASLGVTKKDLFAPSDIEVDSRFEFVAEYRHFPLLRQVRMQDAVLQSVYDWMIHKNYTFEGSPQHVTKAYIAKLIRQFGALKDTLPPYMPLQSIKTNIQFEAVAKALEENIYKKEAEFVREKGYLPSFQDMMAFNEDYRVADCKRHNRLNRRSKDHSVFHSFFDSGDRSCQ